MNAKKMKAVFAEEAFVKALLEMESVTEMQAALSEKGVEMSEEDVASIRTFFDKVTSGEISREQLEEWSEQADSGEIPEDLLEMVAGGSFTLFGCIFAAVGLLFTVGFGIAEGEWRKSKLAEASTK